MNKLTVNVPDWAQKIFGDVDPPIEAIEDLKAPGTVAAKEMADMCQSVRDEKIYGFKDDEK